MRKIGQKLVLIWGVISLVCAAPMALGDWDPGDLYKMHEPQEPDRYGWDICLVDQFIADDWQCTEDGYVTDIHFWISWYHDNVGQVEEWYILIAEDMGGMPGPPIWQWDGLGNMKTRWYGAGDQGWHCPSFYEDTIHPDHVEYYQVNITNIENAFFQERGKLYWLMIMAWVPTYPDQVVGWKTSYTQNFSPALWTWDPWMGPWEPVETWDGWTDMAFVITSERLDFGDAPDRNYATLLASNGARHMIVPGVYLGSGVDSESDGQPDPQALGDDNDGNDDEDGVVFTSPLIPGQLATVDITASVAGSLTAWIDFNANGQWDYTLVEENIYAGQPLNPGLNSLTFNVPTWAAANTDTIARFRFVTAPVSLTYWGLCGDGEVEDYQVHIEARQPKPPLANLKWSQPPIEIDPTWEMPVYCGWDEPSYLLSLMGGGCVVVPNANISVEGDTYNAWPFNIAMYPASSMRYQQIYDEAEVGRAGVITEIRFRPDQYRSPFGPNSMDVEIYLGYSANPVSAPSGYFANNIGAGYVKVYDGTLTLSSSAAGGPPHNFDIVVDVDDVFMYNPANGPLLLDVKMLSMSDTEFFDAEGDSSGQTATTRIFSHPAGSVSDPCGIINYLGPTDPPYGLVTMFCFNGATPSMSAASRTNAVAAPPSEPSEFERLAGGGPDAVVSVSSGPRESSQVPVSSAQAAVQAMVAPAALASVAIFQDTDPWGSTWNQDILTANGISWTIYGTPDMGVVDLSPYDKVIVSSVQNNAFYTALETNRAWFEAYANAGGILDLHLASYSGQPISGKIVPGGFVVGGQPGWNDVTIVDGTHPVLNMPHTITEAELDGVGYSIHGYFVTVPVGAHEVIEDANSGNPCTMELVFGAGRIFATVQTVEYAGSSYNYLENTILYDLLVQVQGKIVADDFRCIGPMPVMSVHWWGSYFGWEAPEPPPEQPTAWRIGFWSNVPAGAVDPEIYYSYPDKLLWQIEVPAERVKLEWVGYDEFPQMPGDSCFQYYVDLEPKEVFWQNDFIRKTKDNVFWLSVAAVYPADSDIVFPWGWKTRPWSWMDDAVWFELYHGLYTGMITDPWDITPIEDPRTGESFDVAFELDTDPNWIKWEQPFTGIRDWPHYEDELSMGMVRRYTEIKWLQLPDLEPEVSIDVDATTEGQWPPQILADDFRCQATGPITDIHIWGSWWHDYYGKDPREVIFTLSIHEDIPADASPTRYSMPGRLLWMREFQPGQFDAWLYGEGLTEGWYVPCAPYYEPYADSQCWQYDFYIDREEAFHQKEGTIYWLDVQARPLDPGARFGWKTSIEHWNDDGVFAVGHEPYEDIWGELRYPAHHPYAGESIDLAFAITTETEELEIARLAADDWPCEANTPVTAATWWGSYIGYQYEACQPEMSAPPVKPDYFLLRVWDDVPAGVDLPYSHPNNVIWQYKAYDYDEVLVGYDKHPHAYIPNGAAAGVQAAESSPAIPQVSDLLSMSNQGDALNSSDVVLPASMSAAGLLSEALVSAAPPGTVYVTGTWMDNAVHYLDGNLNDLGSFAAGSTNPNGMATDGTLIWTGHFTTSEVIAYDMDGVEQFRWSGTLGGLQGMEYISPGELAIYNSGPVVEFYDPFTGALVRTIPGQLSIEGLAWDGQWLWQLDDSVIYATDIATGAVLNTIPNPAVGETYGGTGITASAPGELTVAGNSGNWWKIDSGSGAVLVSGNNGLDMMALKVVPVVPGREPVFRYSVRLPKEAWFWQEDANNIYWFSVTAVYDGSLPNYDWGWTNHAYVAKDDAVAGYVDVSGPEPVWMWEELFDQTGVSEDLSFILFTWPWPPCWGYLTQCHGDADGDGSVKGSDFLALKSSWYKCYPDPLYNPCADFDRNGCVKGSDFLILKKYWYQNPPADCPRGAKWPP